MSAVSECCLSGADAEQLQPLPELRDSLRGSENLPMRRKHASIEKVLIHSLLSASQCVYDLRIFQLSFKLISSACFLQPAQLCLDCQ